MDTAGVEEGRSYSGRKQRGEGQELELENGFSYKREVSLQQELRYWISSEQDEECRGCFMEDASRSAWAT